MLDCQEPSAPDPQLPTGGRLGRGQEVFVWECLGSIFICVLKLWHSVPTSDDFHAQSLILTKMIGGHDDPPFEQYRL